MSQTTRHDLDGTTVGIFVAPAGTEEVEFTEPRAAVADAGADVVVLSSESGEATTVEGDLEERGTYDVDRTFAEVGADEFDALIVPGGTVGADRLRTTDGAVDLVAEHVADDGPIGVICHGPWLLVEADVVEGRTLTSYPSLATDVRNAGGEWVDESVVTDGNLVTSRKPDDLSDFQAAILETFEAVTG